MASKSSDNSQQDLDTYFGVLSSIAGSSASLVDGVASVSYEAGLNNKFFDYGKNKRNNAIDVKFHKDNLLTIDVSINVYYGYRIPVVICNLQEKIKEDIEKSTYFKVKAINVTVVGVVSRH